MIKLRQVFGLYGSGYGSRSISTTLGISRTTIRKYLRIFNESSLSLKELLCKDGATLFDFFGLAPTTHHSPRLDALSALLPDYAKRLRKRGVTRKALYSEYIKRYPQGYSYCSFNRFLRAYMNLSKTIMHIEYKAGEKLFIDFAGDRQYIINPTTGQKKYVEVFVAILPTSQYTYVEAVMSQSKEDLIMATRHALEFFGGVPTMIVPDNLKAAVKHPNGYEAEINDDFEAFATHYHAVVMPARVRKPKDKALVEDAVKLTYARIYPELKEEDRGSLETLNQAIRSALEKHNNMILTGRTYSRREQFEDIEQSQLKPLPTVPFELHNRKMLTVQRNGHVRLLGHYYSVPHTYVGKKVTVFYTSQHVEIYQYYRLIAQHIRNYQGFGFTTIKEHLPAAHRLYLEEDPTPYLKRAKEIDPVVEDFLQIVIERKKPLLAACKSCKGILSFENKVGKDRLIAACKYAHKLGVYNYLSKAKGSILQELKKIERTELLILDDFGLQPLDTTARSLLMDIIEDRHGKKSTIIASQIPIGAWYEAIADQTVADAIMDRIIHGAIKIQLKGESMRKRKNI
ncbi:IS21 family transposase [Segatella oris]|uniref:IS21 family transposase n=1 Tax=Segatella oris TaxID=28135 RepID=UPI0036F40452